MEERSRFREPFGVNEGDAAHEFSLGVYQFMVQDVCSNAAGMEVASGGGLLVR